MGKLRARLISGILIFLLIFNMGINTFAVTSSGFDGFIDKLAQKSSADRKAYIASLTPLLVDDSGIDLLENMISDYDANSDSIFSPIIGSIVDSVGKEKALEGLDKIRSIDSDIRRKYLKEFNNRTEYKLSQESETALTNYINESYSKKPNLQIICEEDSITTGVVANLLSSIPEINDGRPILTNDGDGFKIYYASDSAEASGVLDQLVEKVDGLTSSEKEDFKIFGKELGLYIETEEPKPTAEPTAGPTAAPTSTPGKNGSGSSYTNISNSTSTPMPTSPQSTTSKPIVDPKSDVKIYESGDMELKYSVVEESTIQDATELNILCYRGGSLQESTDLGESVKVSIPVNYDNVMVYRVINNELVPIKYSYVKDGMLTLTVEESGNYALKVIPSYFNDVSGWSQPYIEMLYNRGIINGKSEGSFEPESNITREEFIKLIVELFGIPTYGSYENIFSDVQNGQWYEKYILTAYDNGLINGVGNGEFGVGQNISRQDICKIIVNAIEKFGININKEIQNTSFADINSIDDYAKDSVLKVKSLGIVSGDQNGLFSPKDNATRAETAKIIYGVLELYVNK